MNLFTPNEPRPDDTGAEKKRKANKPVSAEKKSSDTAKKSFVAAKVSNILRRKSPNAENVSETQKPQNIEQYVKQQLEKNESSEQPAAESVDLKEIKKQFNRKRAQIPEYSNVQRYSPDISAGLTDAQVNERYSQFLFNDTNQKYSKSYASILIGNLCTFFNLLCVLAAIALAYSQAPVSQFLFVVIFALNLGFGIVTEIVAKRKIDKLSLLTVPTSKVVRNGAVAEVKSKEIVLDDIVVLSLGNQIPADCIVLDGVVEVNESLLTGESVPVKKEPGDLLYAGSFISSGTCKARADKVGKATYLNSLSAKAKKYKKPNSELMRSSKLIIYIVGILIIPIAALMFFVNWNNYIPSEISRLNDTIQRTVSIVIGMIPSGMLLLTSIALTLGIIRLMLSLIHISEPTRH